MCTARDSGDYGGKVYKSDKSDELGLTVDHRRYWYTIPGR